MKLEIVRYCQNCRKEVVCKEKKGVSRTKFDAPYYLGEHMLLAVGPDDAEVPNGWFNGEYEYFFTEGGKNYRVSGYGTFCPDCVKALGVRESQLSKEQEDFNNTMNGVLGTI